MSKTIASQALRAATRGIHEHLEKSPFARAVLDGSLGEEAYVGYLRILAVLHATLERCLNRCDHPSVVRVWDAELQRLPDLLEDADHYRPRLVPDMPRAMAAAMEAASHVLLVSRDAPLGLLGCLYVLAGSSRGAVILEPRIGAALGVTPGRGLSYLSRHATDGPAAWERAAARLDDLGASSEEVGVMIGSALAIFQHLKDAFTPLWPWDASASRYTVAGLNPESGNHPVPQAREVLEAVLRASDRILADHPYFISRYGTRGRRFTDADGAWLATLPEQGRKFMGGQVAWLGTVLAARGMPRMLLGRHLMVLAGELPRSQPGLDEASGAQRIAMLYQAGSDLSQKMDRLFPPSMLRRHAADMARRLGRLDDQACVEAVDLLAGAVTDELAGAPEGVGPVLGWLTDTNRFSQAWVDAVHHRLDLLRQAAQERPGPGDPNGGALEAESKIALT